MPIIKPEQRHTTHIKEYRYTKIKHKETKQRKYGRKKQHKEELKQKP
jgi:hypothetical protein